MQLSRAEAGIGRAGAEVDLAPVLDMVVSDCAKRLRQPDYLHYTKPASFVLVARMDMVAFAVAARNLIDNARKHGALKGRVDVIAKNKRYNSSYQRRPDLAARDFGQGEAKICVR